MSHTWAISGRLRSASAGHPVSHERTRMTHWPLGGATVATFQAGHASSILVTPSIAKDLVRATFGGFNPLNWSVSSARRPNTDVCLSLEPPV